MKARQRYDDGKTSKSPRATKSNGATRAEPRPEPMSMCGHNEGEARRADRRDDEARSVATSRNYAESRLRQFCLR